ncbi:MAG: PAS domain-containing protein, partial [Planctomycetes bacterium]|nr:PAS domain-containing protein [Planctomycetota bacterium]
MGESTNAWGVRLRYVTALLLVVGSLLTVHAFEDRGWEAERRWTQIVNVAGRQRMLSQRLSKDVLRVFQASTVGDAEGVALGAAELERTRTELRRAHDHLEDVLTSSFVSDATPFRAGFVRVGHSLRSLQEIGAEVGDLARERRIEPDEAALLPRLFEQEAEFLRNMESLVSRCVRTADEQHVDMRLWSWLATIVCVGVVIALGGTIIEPALRRLCDRQRAAETEAKRARQAEAALASERERFDLCVRGSSDGLWDYDPSDGSMWFSDRFRALVGRAEGAFPDRFESLRELMHPNDVEVTVEALRAHLEHRDPFHVHCRLMQPDGEYRWFRCRGQAVWDDAGNATRMAGSISDVHEARLARDRLDLAVRSAGVGLWDWEVPSGQTWFSDTFYTMLGYAPGELPMNLDTWQQICHPEDLPRAFEEIQKHFDGRADVYRCEQRLRCADGVWRWILDVGEVVEWDADGKPLRMIGAHLDIDELHGAMERARASNRAKGEFLANMSHEIRTPLTAILGFAEVAEDTATAPADSPLADALRTIRRNGEHLITIINDILDVSKIEAGK